MRSFYHFGSAQRAAVVLIAAAVLTAGCGSAGPGVAGGANGVMPQHVNSSGGISWNHQSVRLRYPSKGHGEAVLTFWGQSGYYTRGVDCKNKGRVKASIHRKFGDPSGYEHVVYWFKAKTKGPKECRFSALLESSGSPPIAVLRLPIVH